MSNTVTGIFYNQTAAQSAITQMEQAGVLPSQISMVMTDKARGTHFRFAEDTKADEGAAAGAGLGGMAGALAGAILAAGTIAIPGLNLVVTGALISSLAGLGAGAAAGGLLGGLIGAGFAEHEAKFFEKEIKSGNVLVAVQTETDAQKSAVEAVFKNQNVRTHAA